MEFSQFNLNDDLKKSLAEAGYITAMPVQEQVIQKALDGADVYVQSQTGTGKTAAYLIVIMQRMMTDPLLKGKKALIMVPTRELAVQVEEEAKVVGKYCSLKTASFYGGVGYGQQQASLKNDVQIMVGTPGRVLDLNSSGAMNLMELGFLVLDEADRMFDMGFYPDLRKLIQVVPPAEKRQTMLFSATLNAYVKNLAWEYTKEPVEIEIEPEHITVNEITQLLYHVSSDDKFRLLLGILEREKPETAIIFCNTKRYTEIISRRLLANGFENEFISGDLPQVRRLKIIENIKNGKTKLLIATDVAARGLDIEGLDLVVNYDLPVEPENYVHRIGRTARAGKTGKAIALASEQDVYELSDIEKYIEMRIPSEVANAQLFVENKERASRGEHRRDEQDNRRPRRNSGQRRERPGGQRQERYGNPTERRERRRTGRPHKAEDGRGENGTKNAPSAGYQHIGNLSFEERMAYYRQKYDKNNREGTRDSDKREKSRRGKSLKTKHRKADKEQRKPEESSKKPGLLARLTNLFKRKK